MRIQPIITYKSVRLRNLILLPHSPLYHLEPVGVGTELVESLSGYIVRLAEAHCVPPTALCVKEIIPLIRQTKQSQQDRNSPSINLRNRNLDTLYKAVLTLNGMGTFAQDWVKAVELLTSHKNLKCLTLLTWRDVISTNSLLRSKRAWCDFCYRDQKLSDNIIYEQLVWTIKEVTVCSIHHCSLRTVCPYCSKILPILNAKSRPGYCCFCHEWLGADDNSIELRDSKYKESSLTKELLIASTIGELLAASSKIIEAPQRECITKSIKTILDYHTNGKMVTLTKRFGLPEKAIFDLFHEKHLPRITTLVKLCLPINISLLSFLQCSFTINVDNSNSINLKSYWEGGKRPYRFRNYEEEHRVLMLALQELPPPSLSEVALRLDYDPKNGFMCKTHPSLSRQLKARYKSFIHGQPSMNTTHGNKHIPRKKENVSHAENTILKELQNAFNEVPPPPLHKVARRCKSGCEKLKRRYPDICNKLVKHREEFEIKQKQEKRLILEAALLEEPMPTLLKMANRVGFKAVASIVKFYPEIHREAILRRKDIRKQWPKDIGKKLEQKLKEAPPKSLNKISEQLGYNAGYLYQKRPTLCHKISVRFKLYKRKLSKQKKSTLYKQMRKIVLELHHQGIVPTAQRVHSHLPKNSICLNWEFFKLLRQLKSELNLS